MDQLSPKARKLASEHLGLVSALAHKHRNWHSHDRPGIDDLIAEGNLALCLAASNWDPKRGNPFVLHATVLINRAFANLDRAWSHPVSIPKRAVPLLRSMREAQNKGASTPREVAAATGINVTKVQALWSHLFTGFSELEEASHLHAEQSIEEGVEIREEEEFVRNAVSALPGRQRQVVEARFGWSTGSPLLTAEIADYLGLTVEQVEAAEKKAMKTLRSVLT